MALLARRLCVALFCIFCPRTGLGLSYSDLKVYRYDVPSSSSLVPDIVLQSEDNTPVRSKRYLAKDEEYASMFRSSLTNTGDDSAGGTGGSKSGGGNGDSIQEVKPENLDIAMSSSIVPDTTKKPLSYNKSEPKTGGNYKSLNDTIKKSVSDMNRTTAQKPTTATPVVESPKPPTSTTKENTSETVPKVQPDETNTTSSTVQDDIISKFANFDEVLNKSLFHHNISKSNEDHHAYYKSTFHIDEKIGQYYWIDMDNNSDVQINEMLSQSHRRAATVKLSFNFPFYGHVVRNVTIATGGFLYTGEYVHSWLAATQYIAPLMANFDTSISNDSFIKYTDNGTQFTVQWDKVKLQDKPDSGVFTFQATLRNNGDIIFVYQSVPVVIGNITDEKHPVKVGLSDAYIIDRTILFVRRKTIFEYHRVTFENHPITNWTVIYLSALPTCPNATNCTNCLTRDIGFDCFWCPRINKCSNGIDRNRQEWLATGCDVHSFANSSQCLKYESTTEITSSTTEPTVVGHEAQKSHEDTDKDMFAESTNSFNVSALIGVLFFVGFIMIISLWVFYAYRNPHTSSGQLLIKYRPSQWSWRRGEARYTAATIHM